MTLYDVLELKGPPDCPCPSRKEIKEQFKRLALLHHPDKSNGKREKFEAIKYAYDILIDPMRKNQYDEELHARFYAGGSGYDHRRDRESNNAFSPFETKIFHILIDGLGRAISSKYAEFMSSPSPSASPLSSSSSSSIVGTNDPLEWNLKITIEDLYNCRSKKLKISTPQICEDCQGIGGKKKLCHRCSAQQGICELCDVCHMRGYVIDPMCAVCNGKQYLTVPNIFFIHLSPGIEVSQPIEIKDKNDNSIVRIVLDLTHTGAGAANYECRGSDLWLALKIPIFEALGNLRYTHKHLDGNSYIFTYKELIPPSKILVAKGLGLEKEGQR